MPFQSNPFLQQLRESTSDIHQLLEQTPVSKKLLHPEAGKHDLTAYLVRLFPVVSFVEQFHYAVLTGWVPDLSKRYRAHLLENDLALLSGKPESLQITLPASTENRAAAVPEALGAMYVMEGSSLGGRVILKALKQSMGVDKSSGAAYFAGYEDQTGPMWHTFLEALTTYESDYGYGAAIIESAVKTFNLFHRSLK